MTKAQMRRAIGEQVRAMTQSERAEKSARIAKRIFSLPGYQRARSVFFYAGLENEPDTLGMIRKMIAEGKRVYLPVTRERGVMDAVRVLDTAHLRPARYGILEPPEGETAPPDSLDLILLPGAAFDRSLFRLGRGAGFYDRYLEHTRALTVGVAFSCQLVDEVPREAHDKRVSMLILEDATIGGVGHA